MAFKPLNCTYIRTKNPGKSTFVAVHLETLKIKGSVSRTAVPSRVFKLIIKTAKTWQNLKGCQQILLVLENKKFVGRELVLRRLSLNDVLKDLWGF